MNRPAGYVHPRRARALAAIKAALPGTKTGVVKASGLCRTTVFELMDVMHESGEVHIGRWQAHPVRGPNSPVYFAGPGEDAKDTLPRLTKKEVARRYEKRIKGTEKDDQRKAVQRTRHWTKKAATTKSTWFSALVR